MTKKQLTTIRKRLEAELAASMRAAPPEDLALTLTGDIADQASSRTQREFAAQTVNERHRKLTQLRSALGRIDSSEYGYCEECGEPIRPKRIEAVPWATTCVACQEELESALAEVA